MKCPECGQWNRASMPHCFNCGTPLNIDEASRIAWKDVLRDGGPSTSYLRADEFGQMDATPDPRDALAGEMQELKIRKQEGARRQSRMSRVQPRTSPEPEITEEEVPFGHPGRETVQLHAVRITPTARNEQLMHQESESRHRVRYMDENSVFAESRSYDPAPQADTYRSTGSWHLAGPLSAAVTPPAPKRHIFLKITLALLLTALLGAGGYFGWRYFVRNSGPGESRDAIVTASMMEDVAAHTIMIPGENGTSIYIRELHASYLVVDGYATLQVADHTWYDNMEGNLEESMDVTLTPFLKTSTGQQTPMPVITYPIIVPTSQIVLESPDSLRTDVSTTMYTIRIVVDPGSRVRVNDIDCSDTVSSETGEMSYNATVQPIGDNVFNISVRSQYCREHTISVVLYREPQEIPLDLAVGTYGTTDRKIMPVTATTLPGAYVEVTTPHTDLNITDLDSTGKFSFNAVFDKIGDNTITISSSYPGMRTSVVNHVVYYLPPASEYTRKAWPLSADGYSELLSNISVRIANGQVYVVTGIVQYSVSDKPQMVVINTSEDGKSQPVLLQNFTKIKWKVGTYYRIYADAFSTYNSMPWLNARYTYPK